MHLTLLNLVLFWTEKICYNRLGLGTGHYVPALPTVGSQLASLNSTVLGLHIRLSTFLSPYLLCFLFAVVAVVCIVYSVYNILSSFSLSTPVASMSYQVTCQVPVLDLSSSWAVSSSSLVWFSLHAWYSGGTPCLMCCFLHVMCP
eukprot:jgi/Botrbrau1/13404/Bobra.0082s0011.1